MAIKSALLVGALALAPSMALAETTESETIIVTARPNPEDPAVVAEARDRLSRTPGAVSVVANESYEGRASTGLTDLMRDVPGVLVQRRYGEESRFSIRGSGLDQSFHQRGVLLAQDGVPFADADGFADFQKVDPLTARYVEVYRGGNALRFGGAQLGGALNLITPTGRTAQSENSVRAEAGSFGFARASGQIARAWGYWDAFAALNSMQGDGFRDHAEQDQVRATLNIGRSFGDDREVRAIFYGADINQDVPGTLTLAQALANPEAASGAAKTFDWQRDQTVFRGTLQTRWRFSDALVFEGGAYATTTDLYHPISLLIDQQIETQGLFGRFDWQGEFAGRPADLYWGISYRQGHVDQLLAPVMFPIADNSRREATGMEVFAEGRVFVTDALALVAGGSYGRFTRDYENRLNPANDDSLDDDWFAPRIGLIWQSQGGVQIYANITNSVEPPHYGALVQAPFPGFVPVEPQEAWTGEISTRGRSGAFVWDVTLYRAELENELLSFTPGVGIPAAFFNADDTIHQGVELAFDWEIADGWLLRQSFTYSDFFFDGDARYGDNQMPVAPEHQYRGTLRYRHASGWFVAPSVERRPGDTWVDYSNTLQAPGYTIWSVNAGWDFDNGVSLFVDARNLSDETYVPELGAIVNASAPGANTAVFYPGEGRAVYGGVSYRF